MINKQKNDRILCWDTVLDADDVDSGCITIPGKFTVITGGFSKREDISEVIIGEGVKMVDEYVFRDCLNLLSVSLPDTLVYLGNDVFRGCSALKSVNIADGVIEIQARSFSGCAALETITIPESVRWISHCAFEGCDNLKKLNIPEHLSKIIEGSQISYIVPQSDIESEKAQKLITEDSRYEYIYNLNRDLRIRWLTDSEIASLSDVIKVTAGKAPPQDYWTFLNLTGSLPWFRSDKIAISRYGDEGVIQYNGTTGLYECYDMDCSITDFESNSLLDAYDFAIEWNETYN